MLSIDQYGPDSSARLLALFSDNWAIYEVDIAVSDLCVFGESGSCSTDLGLCCPAPTNFRFSPHIDRIHSKTVRSSHHRLVSAGDCSGMAQLGEP